MSGYVEGPSALQHGHERRTCGTFRPPARGTIKSIPWTSRTDRAVHPWANDDREDDHRNRSTMSVWGPLGGPSKLGSIAASREGGISSLAARPAWRLSRCSPAALRRGLSAALPVQRVTIECTRCAVLAHLISVCGRVTYVTWHAAMFGRTVRDSETDSVFLGARRRDLMVGNPRHAPWAEQELCAFPRRFGQPAGPVQAN